MIDFTREIKIQTTRSGGKGGQNVNKVETAVVAHLNIYESPQLTDEQKSLLTTKLSNRLNKSGELVIRSQTHRTQLANRQEAIEKINKLVDTALLKKTIRIATRVSKAAKRARVEQKQRKSEIKSSRKKFRPGTY